MTFQTVRAIGLKLPGAEAATMYGEPALKVKGQMFACIASHKSAEPNTLVVRIDFAQRDALLAEDPETYYLKEHYEGYACVLVRLSRVSREAMHDLLAGAWRMVNASGRPARRSARPRSPASRGRRPAK
jgi:hypothetical protein